MQPLFLPNFLFQQFVTLLHSAKKESKQELGRVEGISENAVREEESLVTFQLSAH
jgi:hypothetical protein